MDIRIPKACSTIFAEYCLFDKILNWGIVWISVGHKDHIATLEKNMGKSPNGLAKFDSKPVLLKLIIGLLPNYLYKPDVHKLVTVPLSNIPTVTVAQKYIIGRKTFWNPWGCEINGRLLFIVWPQNSWHNVFPYIMVHTERNMISHINIVFHPSFHFTFCNFH